MRRGGLIRLRIDVSLVPQGRPLIRQQTTRHAGARRSVTPAESTGRGMHEPPTVAPHGPSERGGSSIYTRCKLDKRGNLPQAANEGRISKGATGWTLPAPRR